MTKLLGEASEMHCKLFEKVLLLKSFCFCISQDETPPGEKSAWQKF